MSTTVQRTIYFCEGVRNAIVNEISGYYTLAGGGSEIYLGLGVETEDGLSYNTETGNIDGFEEPTGTSYERAKIRWSNGTAYNTLVGSADNGEASNNSQIVFDQINETSGAWGNIKYWGLFISDDAEATPRIAGELANETTLPITTENGKVIILKKSNSSTPGDLYTTFPSSVTIDVEIP